MEKPTSKALRIANLTSNIFNPFLISAVLIVLFSFTSTTTTSEAFKWAGISMTASVLPIFLLVVYFYRTGHLDNFFISVRGQRTRIYVLGGIITSAGLVLLAVLGAPPILLGAFFAGLFAALIFAFINLRWKISVHTGFMAGSSIALVMLFGWVAAISVALVPLTAWARIKQESHSLAQTIGGAIMAAIIVSAVFLYLDLV